MFWVWDLNDRSRFNPLDASTSNRPRIAVLQSIEALREFVTSEDSESGEKLMSNAEFAELLRLAAKDAEEL